VTSQGGDNKEVSSTPSESWPATLPAWPKVDFAAFGPVETVALPRVQQLTASYLARNWARIPHVTHQDEADVTELEAKRVQLTTRDPEAKLTVLAYCVKAVADALKVFPRFNASLDSGGKALVLKKYFHVGVVVQTPRGLVVPVVRDCDRKDVLQIAEEIARLAATARKKGLPLDQMSGGCISISSLGKLGGTAFTPIINAPEVAMLGLCRIQDRLVRSRSDGTVRWRAMLPMSLSYDHRVIDGTEAGSFLRYLSECLARFE
jgi:pyruvate dehydrogenase E2 component (dihydrolipoamide acetyltransferase)